MRITLLLIAVLGLSACETAEGFVQDSENLGDAVTAELND